MFTFIWQVIRRAEVQTLGYQILKSLLFRIRIMTQIFSVPNILPGHLVHADKGDEGDNLVKCMRLTRTWTSSPQPVNP